MPPKLAGKIYVPLTGKQITVELRFKTEKHGSWGIVSLGYGRVSTSDVNAAKGKAGSGCRDILERQAYSPGGRPVVRKKEFCHRIQDRLGGRRRKTIPSRFTINMTGRASPRHGDGRIEKYLELDLCARGRPLFWTPLTNTPTQSQGPETVKYIKPDGTLDVAISAPYNGKSVDCGRCDDNGRS